MIIVDIPVIAVSVLGELFRNCVCFFLLNKCLDFLVGDLLGGRFAAGNWKCVEVQHRTLEVQVFDWCEVIAYLVSNDNLDLNFLFFFGLSSGAIQTNHLNCDWFVSDLCRTDKVRAHRRNRVRTWHLHQKEKTNLYFQRCDRLPTLSSI